MKLYLSSYRLGNHSDKLKQLVGKTNARVAVSVNALDNQDKSLRNDNVLRRELTDMQQLEFSAEELDLRDYFGETGDSLVSHLSNFDLIWFSGGNVFLLIKAIRQSRFYAVFEQLISKDKLVYSGYSAAFCCLSPSLKGMEMVDDKDAIAEGYKTGEVWEGLGIINFHPIVHFRSNHHESELVEKEYQYVLDNNIDHITFADGDVYLVDGDKAEVLR